MPIAPLTAMRGYIETLTMHELSLDAATRAKYLGIVEDETHRLERIVGDLLDVAKLESGGITLRQEHVTVQTLFDRVRARHGREAAARQIAIAAEVRATTGGHSRRASAAHLRSLLQS